MTPPRAPAYPLRHDNSPPPTWRSFPPEVIHFQRSFGQSESSEEESSNFWLVHVR